MSHKTITISQGASSITVSMPEYPYASTVKMPFHYFEPWAGQYTIWDDGSTYDLRFCDVTFLLDSDDQNDIQTFFEGAGRATNVDIALGAGSGFYPFAPDLGDGNTFTAHPLSVTPSGQLHAPWKWWETRFNFSMVSKPEYNLPAEIADGSMSIGNVTGVRYPQEGFGLSVNYKAKSVITLGSDAYAIDWGTGADRYETKWKIEGNHTKIAAILNELTAVVRGGTFSIQAAADQYPFGRKKQASGTYVVQLLSPEIKTEHYGHDQFSIELSLNFVSAA